MHFALISLTILGSISLTFETFYLNIIYIAISITMAESVIALFNILINLIAILIKKLEY